MSLRFLGIAQIVFENAANLSVKVMLCFFRQTPSHCHHVTLTMSLSLCQCHHFAASCYVDMSWWNGAFYKGAPNLVVTVNKMRVNLTRDSQQNACNYRVSQKKVYLK